MKNNFFDIQNRRYIGSKTKLLSNIEDSIPEKYKSRGLTFADLFSGTGVVAYDAIKMGYKVIVNDFLYSNYVIYKAFFSDKPFSLQKLERVISLFNDIPNNKIKRNYFSDIYGEKYFSINDAKRIGYARDFIEDNKDDFTEREYFILITSLIYFADKIANTCGHFEYFLKKTPVDCECKINLPNVADVRDVEIYNEDANLLGKQIKADIVYLDPPYNARQYVNFYHVLENLARWDKPTVFEGNSMKFKRNNLKSGYSKACATTLLKDLVDNLNCKLIIVSYNNTYNAKSSASNNRISEQDLENILKEKGKVSIKEIRYKFFNSGKTELKNHLERLYICEVGK